MKKVGNKGKTELPKSSSKAKSKSPASGQEVDLDALFAEVKQKKKSKRLQEDQEAVAGVISEDPVKRSKKSKDAPVSSEASSLPYGIIKSNIVQIINPEAPVERIDSESGYKVYKAHLLKVGEGGGTELCPFDCDCCF